MTLPVKYKYSYSGNDQKKGEQKAETYECNICGKKFYRKASLTLHVNSHNFNNNLDEKSDKEIRNTCNICFKKFTAKKNLLKHLRDVHKNFSEAERMVVKKIKCPEKNCEFLCRMMKELRDHIEKFHKIKILRDTLQFPSESVFQKWKKEEESNTVSWFVTGRKKTTLMDGTKKQTFYCHRTGHYSPKGFGKYRMRSVGSCKIGVTCPAAMEVIESPDGELTVIYYKTHLGHMQDVVYLKLSREERTHIAEKIKQGFSFDAILEDVKESQNFDGDKKKRIHLLSKKDLYSIMRTENRSNGKSLKKNPEDSIGNELENKSNQNIEKVVEVKENVHESCTEFSLHNVVSPQDKEEKIHEKYQKDVSIPQTSREGVASQIVILSPEMDYTSIAEIILLSPSDGSPPTQPAILPEIPVTENSSDKTEAKNKNKSNLHSQLNEKLQKISELLPQSEFLTPKQFDLINTKLNGILDIFNMATSKANARKQNVKKKIIKKDKNSKSEFDYKIKENLGQQMYGSSLVYAIYN